MLFVNKGWGYSLAPAFLAFAVAFATMNVSMHPLMFSPATQSSPIVAPCKGSLMQTYTTCIFAFALPGALLRNLGAIGHA